MPTKEQIIDLTLKAYKISGLLPKKEPLRLKIRETAAEILGNCRRLETAEACNRAKARQPEEDLLIIIKQDLEALDSYFEIARWQNWTSFFDILKVKEEYGIVRAVLEEKLNKLSEEPIVEKRLVPLAKLMEERVNSFKTKENAKEKPLNLRSKKIIELLKERGRLQVWEVSEAMPDVSKRTLRRDFVDLLEQGMIERIGEKNNTFYRLKAADRSYIGQA